MKGMMELWVASCVDERGVRFAGVGLDRSRALKEVRRMCNEAGRKYKVVFKRTTTGGRP